MTKAKFIKFIIASVLAIAALFLPYESLGFDAASPMGILNPLEIRVIGVFVMAALFWILQPFPIWSTSMLVIVLMIVTMSDSALAPFRVDGVTMISHKSIMATFANPIIMLFLGGFFLAAAATKYKMDLNLARVLLKPFGKNPKFVLLGLMRPRAPEALRQEPEVRASRPHAHHRRVLDVHEQHRDRRHDARHLGPGAQAL